MKNCCICNQPKPDCDFYSHKETADRLNTSCKECDKKRSKEWLRRNTAKAKATNAKYVAKNRERILAEKIAWGKRNAELCRERARARYHSLTDDEKKKLNREQYRKTDKKAAAIRSLAWAKSHPVKMAALSAKRRAVVRFAFPKWANTFFIEEAYDLAKRRTVATGFKWHVDHIVPLINKLVCGLHVESNLQVIPAKQNWSKNNRYWPDMPGSFEV